MPDQPGYYVMHGPQFAKKFVTDYLSTDIPVRIIDYRNAWQVDDIALPTPEKFISYEPLAIDHWPTVITVAISTNSFERVGYEGNYPLIRVQYQMRTYIWVRTEGNEEVTLMRDQLTTVLRSALLDKPCLDATDPRGTFKVSIDENSLGEEFSDVSLLKGDRVMAGAYLGYQLSIDEALMRRTIGTVQQFDFEANGVGIGQSLPTFEDA